MQNNRVYHLCMDTKSPTHHHITPCKSMEQIIANIYSRINGIIKISNGFDLSKLISSSPS